MSKTIKERMEEKIAAAVLKVQEEASVTADVDTTTAAAAAAAEWASTSAGTPSNACISPVPQGIVHPPGGPAPAFDVAASVGGSTLASPGIQQYGLPWAYHNERYSPYPAGYAVSINQGRYHPYSIGRGRSSPHTLGFAVMVLLQDVTGRNKSMLPAEI
jgi:hypothetical protein